MKFRIVAITAALLFGASCEGVNEQEPEDTPESAKSERIVDLSYDFDENTVYWVNAEEFERETVADGVTDAGFYYSAYNYSAAEHGGTHIDSPIHFAEGKLTVDKIPLERLMGPGAKIDVSEKVKGDRNYLITIEDIENWEKSNGRLEDGTILLFQTGFGAYYPDKEKYLGTSERGDAAVKDLSFPGLSPETAEWLVKNRKIDAVGIDTASIDRGQSTEFAAHVALMTHDIPAFENVANLGDVPSKGFRIVALPMKIKGGSGGPLRIIAFVAD